MVRIDEKWLTQTRQIFGAAPLDPAAWATGIDRIADAFGANGALLFNPVDDLADPMTIPVGSAVGLVPDYFAQQWLAEDPWILASLPRGFNRQGMVCPGESVLAVSQLRRTRFFTDFAKRYDFEGVVCLKVCDDRDALAPVKHLSL